MENMNYLNEKNEFLKKEFLTHVFELKTKIKEKTQIENVEALFASTSEVLSKFVICFNTKEINEIKIVLNGLEKLKNGSKPKQSKNDNGKNSRINQFIRDFSSFEKSLSLEEFSSIMKIRVENLDNSQNLELILNSVNFIKANWTDYQKFSQSNLLNLDFLIVEYLSNNQKDFSKFFNNSVLDTIKKDLSSDTDRLIFDSLINNI